jgi:hypothetical protein
MTGKKKGSGLRGKKMGKGKGKKNEESDQCNHEWKSKYFCCYFIGSNDRKEKMESSYKKKT